MKKKADYQNMLLKMLKPLTRHYLDDGSGLSLGAASAGYGNRIAELEGFSRVLWGLASYWAGGGTDRSLLPVYQKGLAAGTDPVSFIHLTLAADYSVWISVGAGSFKKKKKEEKSVVQWEIQDKDR